MIWSTNTNTNVNANANTNANAKITKDWLYMKEEEAKREEDRSSLKSHS